MNCIWSAAAGNIIDGDTEKTLELVWQLILHYQIDCRSQEHCSLSAVQRKNVCKQSMLVWVNGILNGRKITNFSTDWNDGKNLVALVNFCKPNLVSGSINIPSERLVYAMRVAEEVLGVPRIISADDMLVHQPDEVSVMTYLSYFCCIDSPGEKALQCWIQQLQIEESTSLCGNWWSGVQFEALFQKLTFTVFPHIKASEYSGCMKQVDTIFKLPSSCGTGLGYLSKLAYLVQFYASAEIGKPVVVHTDVSKVSVSPVNRGLVNGTACVWIDVDCSTAGCGEVSATVTNGTGVAVDVLATEIKVGTEEYRVSFSPLEGMTVYTFKICYAGLEVHGSPFHINLDDPAACKVIHISTTLPTVHAGIICEPIKLIFDTKDAGCGKLIAKASGECAGSVHVEIINKTAGIAEVVFIPPIPEVYTVDVFWGKHVALAKGYSTGTVSIDLYQDSKYNYKLDFGPTTPDMYSVDTKWEGEHVPGSPFTIDLVPPIKPELVEPGDPFFGGVGEMVELLVDLTYAGCGTLTATCKGSMVGTIETSIITISRKLQKVQFISSQIDIYYLSVFFGGVHIKGSPFCIDLNENTHGQCVPPNHSPLVQVYTVNLMSCAKARVKLEPIPKVVSCFIGHALIVRVTPTTKGSSKGACSTSWDVVTASVKGEKSCQKDIKVKVTENGSYEVIFAATECDRYFISIQYEGSAVVGSPFTVVFNKSVIDTSKVQVCVVGEKSCFIRQEFKVEIHISGAGMGVLRVEAQIPGGEKTCVDVTEESDSLYIIRYLPLVAGKHLLYVYWSEVVIPLCPVTLEVKELSVVAPCQTVSFDIAVGKWILCAIKSIGTHLDTGKICEVMRSVKTGRYVFSLQPYEPGTYEIVLRVEGKEICRPFLFKCEKTSLSEKVVIFNFDGNAVVNEILKLKIDVSDAGTGTLNFHIEGPGQADTRIYSFKDGIYTVYFIAYSIGKYTLRITWNGVEVANSPLTISISMPNHNHEDICIIPPDYYAGFNDIGHETAFTGTMSGTTLTIGKASRWNIDISELCGQLHVLAVGDTIDAVDVQLTQLQERVFKAMFSPTKPDKYTISILLNGNHMANSPVIVNYKLAQIDVTKVTISGFSACIMLVGQKTHAVVDIQDAGLGDFKVNPKPPESVDKTHALEINDYDDNPGVFSVCYTPMVVGVHLLELFLSQTPLPGCPLQLTVCDPQQVSYSFISETTVVVSQLVEIEFDTTLAGYSELTATCLGALCGEVTISISCTTVEGKHKISFTPGSEDLYTLMVKLGGYHVKGSPFRFDISSIEIERVTVTGPLWPEGPRGSVTLIVDTEDVRCGKITTVCKCNEVSVSVSVKETSSNVFTLSFQPVEAARYIWSVMYHGQHVPGSPFQINMTPCPGKITVIPPDTGSVCIGQYVCYEINVCKAGRGTLTARCHRDKCCKKITVEITLIRCGVYHVSYRPLSYDRYTLYIQWGSLELPNSPFIYNLMPLKECSVWRKRIEIPITFPASMVVSTAIFVTCSGKKYGSVAIKLTQLSLNKYYVGFESWGPDIYTLSISYNGLPVKGSPYILDLHIHYPDHGKTIDTIIDNESKFTNEYTMTIGSAFIIQQIIPTTSVSVTAAAVGTTTGDTMIHVEKCVGNYLVTFNPKQVDTYSVFIRLNGVQDCYKVDYKEPPSCITNVKITGLEDLLSIFNVSTEICIVINAIKAGTGTFRAEVCGLNNPKPDVCGKEGEVGVYTVSFLPTAAGVYTLSLFWNDEHIPNSPLKIRVIDINQAIHCLPGHIAGIDNMVIDCCPTEITVYAMRKDCKVRLKVTVKQVTQNSYKFIFCHTQPGIYYIHVLVNGVELDLSPIPVCISQPPDAQSCMIQIISSVVFIDEELKMVINCIEGGHGSLEVTVLGPGCTQYTVPITDNKDGTFIIIYTPVIEGKYTFHITWCGEHICGSPFIITVVKKKEDEHSTEEACIVNPTNDCEFTKGKLVTIKIGCFFKFTMRLSQKQAEQFSAKAHNRKGKYFELTIIETEGNKYTYAFKPVSIGLYVLEFKMGKKEMKLPQLPHRINVIEPPADASHVKVIKVSTAGLLLINRKIFFQIDTQLAGKGKITFTFEGPSTDTCDLVIVPSSENPCIYDISFIPVVAGTYHLQLLWGGSVVPGCPLIFNVKKPTIKYGECCSFEICIDSNIKQITSFAIHITTGEKLQVQIHQVSCNRYLFEFFPKICGQYELHVFICGQEITGSPFCVTYGVPPRPSCVVVKCMAKCVVVASIVKFTIRAVSAGDGDLSVKVTGPVVVCAQVIETCDGVFEVQFIPRVVGVYTVKITWSGVEIPQSPFHITVHEGPSGGASIAILIEDLQEPDEDTDDEEEEHPGSCPLPFIIEADLTIFEKTHCFGKIISFRVMHNGFPDSLNIQWKGPAGLFIRIIKGQSANTFEINPSVPGVYVFSLLWMGSVLTGSSYTLQFEMPKTICGLNWEEQVFIVGRCYQFIICTGDLTCGVLKIKCVPCYAAEVTVTAATSTDYHCSLSPMTAGEFMIYISYDGAQIQGSPFRVKFKDPAQHTLNFSLHGECVEVHNVSAVLQSIAACQKVPISLHELCGGQSSLEFVPGEGEEYKLTITCGLKIKREAFSGSSFHLTYVLVEGSASNCCIGGDGCISTAVVGKWSKFVINCEGAGVGKLSAQFFGEGAEVKVVCVSEVQYEVHFCVSTSKAYWLSVKWGGQDIPGSPFTIAAEADTISSIPSISIIKIPWQVMPRHQISFEIETLSVTEEYLRVEATTASGCTMSGTLIPTKSGYLVNVPTSEPGEYSITVHHKGKAMLQEPLKIPILVPG